MIAKHKRYKERMEESGVWSSNSAMVGYRGYNGSRTSWTKYNDDGIVESDWMMSTLSMLSKVDDDNNDDSGQKLEAWIEGSWIDGNGTASLPKNNNAEEELFDPHWFQPRPDKLTFPPNTINYNSMLNAWSRASCYNPCAAMGAQCILLEWMERSPKEWGDAVEPDVLSYPMVIHAWLRGCRGNGGNCAGSCRANVMASLGWARYQDQQRQQQRPSEEGGDYTNQDRIKRAMEIFGALESWERRTHSSKRWRDDDDDDDEEDKDDDEVISDLDNADIPLNGVQNPYSRRLLFRQHDKVHDLDVEVYNSILVAQSCKQSKDNAANVMQLLDWMENLVEELDMPSIRPNKQSNNVALGVISNSASRADTSLAVYYNGKGIVEDKI